MQGVRVRRGAGKTFVHRLATDGKELLYDAFVGRKRGDIPDELL